MTMIGDVSHLAGVSCRISATVLWVSEAQSTTGQPYLLRYDGREVSCSITSVNAVIDPITLRRLTVRRLGSGEFGEVEIETQQPLSYDPSAGNRVTAAFIVSDPLTGATVGAGLISGAVESPGAPASVAAGTGLTVWLTGLSSSGKSTISAAVYGRLSAAGYRAELLDGDVIRQKFSKGLGFSKQDRDENIRRIGYVAELLTRKGVVVLVAAISPYRGVRNEIRRRIGRFLEVYVNAPLEVCETRDLKGIYRRGRAGEVSGVTGLDDPYEAPLSPDLECQTDRETPAESASRVLGAIYQRLATPGA